jgi:hypothetical protein
MQFWDIAKNVWDITKFLNQFSLYFTAKFKGRTRVRITRCCELTVKKL